MSDPSKAPFPAVLTERRDSGAGLSLVTLTPAREHAGGYHSPGQYIEVRAAARGYFALASEVGAPSWELLVRMNGGASDALLAAPEGTVLEVAGPYGKGFPIADTHGRALVVAVAGSALAITRPILRERIARGDARTTSVYIGARSVGEVALAHEVVGWMHAGARVVLCLSRSDAAHSAETLSEARRASGYVQSVLANDVVEGLVTEGLVFAAGPSSMLEDLRTLQRTKASSLEVVTNA